MVFSEEIPFDYENFRTQVEALGLSEQKKALALMLGTFAQSVTLKTQKGKHNISYRNYPLETILSEILIGEPHHLILPADPQTYSSLVWEFSEDPDNHKSPKQSIDGRLFITDGNGKPCFRLVANLGSWGIFNDILDLQNLIDKIEYPVVLKDNEDRTFFANSAYGGAIPVASIEI